MTTPPREELDLAGSWQLVFDPDDAGLAGGWQSGRWPETGPEWTQVPAIWNLEHPDVQGVGFYRKLFSLPPHWEGKAVRLHFEGVSYRAEVWVNGRLAGRHEGAYTPFCLDVSSLVSTASLNEVVVRVASLSKTKPVDGMVLQQSPASKQSWYYVFGGIWGRVFLEALPPVSCESVSVDPDLAHETAQVEIALNNRRASACRAGLRLHLLAPDEATISDQTTQAWLQPGINRLAYWLDIPRPSPWDLDHPDLYQLAVEVTEGEGLTDRLVAAFGMRDFTLRDGEFYLNGKPVFIQGVLIQPHYPVNLVSPPDAGMMEREIRLAKEAGFNLVRVHLRPAPPGFLDLADRLGMLVYAESTLGWIKDSPRLLEHGRREVREMIARDRNHPSVVFWGILNENVAASALVSDPLVRYARALDPTRVVVDNSGGTLAIDQDFGWMDRATMVPDRSTQREEVQDLHLYLGGLVPEPVYAWERGLGWDESLPDLAEEGFGTPGQWAAFDRQLRHYRGKIFVSELGCGGMADLDEAVAGYQGRDNLLDAREMVTFRDSLRNGFAERRLYRVFESPGQLARAAQELQAAGNARHIEAVLANPQVSGYILTQLNDVAWEFHAGILDLWRNPKPAYAASRRLNRPHLLILNTSTPVLYPGCSFRVDLTLVNRAPLASPAQVSVHLVGPGGKEIYQSIFRAPVEAGIHSVWEGALDAGLEPGKYRLNAQLHQEWGVIAESCRDLWVLPRLDWRSPLRAIQTLGKRPAWMPEPGSTPARDGLAKAILIAYPGSLTRADWRQALAEAAAGAAVLVGPLHPQDQVALEELASSGIAIRLSFGIGNWMGCYHWMLPGPLFAGLPAAGLAGEAFVDVLPRYVLSELGGEVFAGSLRNTQTRQEASRMLWYSDIEKAALGRGSLVFCQYRIFNEQRENPIADRLLANLAALAHPANNGEAVNG